MPSGATVGEAPLPMASAPDGGTAALTSGVRPGKSANANVHLTTAFRSPEREGAETAYSLPSMLETYTVLPSGESAGVACQDDDSGGWHRHASSRVCRCEPPPGPVCGSRRANSTPWWFAR